MAHLLVRIDADEPAFHQVDECAAARPGSVRRPVRDAQVLHALRSVLDQHIERPGRGGRKIVHNARDRLGVPERRDDRVDPFRLTGRHGLSECPQLFRPGGRW